MPTDTRSLTCALALAVLAGASEDLAAQSGPAAPVRVPALANRSFDDVDAFLRDQMRRRGIPGLQVAIIRNGRLVHSGAFGMANVEHGVPVTPRTLFTINSATKSFTGVAIMQLVEEGRVDLSAPVSRYLDSLPAPWRPITVRQLLTHSSGVPNIVDQRTGDLITDGDAAAWARVTTLPMEFAPGMRTAYNQTNYVLLGRLIERVTGRPFIEFIADRQFRAARMTHTRFGDSHDVIPNGAQPYRRIRGSAGPTGAPALGRVVESFPPFLRAAAGINTSAEDVARWLIALERGTLLRTAASRVTLWSPGVMADGSTTSWALGWPLISRPEHRAVAGIGGARSAFYVYPEDGVAVVVLTNLQGAAPEELVDEVAGHYLPGLRAVNGGGIPAGARGLRAELQRRGFAQLREVVDDARRRDSTFRIHEQEWNSWGYRLLRRGSAADALAVFIEIVRAYPESANAHDSLAEVYEGRGDRARAIAHYRRSLALDSTNANAREHLEGLGAPLSR